MTDPVQAFAFRFNGIRQGYWDTSFKLGDALYAKYEPAVTWGLEEARRVFSAHGADGLAERVAQSMSRRRLIDGAVFADDELGDRWTPAVTDMLAASKAQRLAQKVAA